MEQPGNIPIFNIPGILFGNIPRNFIGNFSQIFWEYIMGMFHEHSKNNILGTLFGNIPRNFIGNFSQIFWEYIMGMFHEYSTGIYLSGVLLPLGLSAGLSAADTAIQKKIYGSGTTALIISDEEMEDIMKIVKSFEESGLLVKGISEAIKNETKE